MIIASIDQSFTSTGICIFESESGELLEFKLIKTKNTKGFEVRMINIVEELMDFLSNYPISVVVLEGLSMKQNSNTARPLAGLFYYICAELYKSTINYSIIPPKSIKKFAIKGDATKDEMVAAAPIHIKERFLEKCKKTTGLYDLVDAYFIGKYYIYHKQKEITNE